MNNKIYRLLRDNKEQGPFSLQEITTAGLKPYDLVWVDGRSAAWNYPGEMAEFKALVATPENELLNRLNKANENVKAVSFTVHAAVAVNNNIVSKEINKQPKPRYKVSASWSKIQTITTPAYNNDLLIAEPKKISAKKIVQQKSTSSAEAKSLSWEQAWKDWENEKNGSVTKQQEVLKPLNNNIKPVSEKVVKATPVLEKKFEQSLDTLADSYIDNLIKQKKRERSFSFGKASEFVLPSIALVVIFSIGYWLMNSRNNQTLINPVKPQTVSVQSKENTQDLNSAQPVISKQYNVQPAVVAQNENDNADHASLKTDEAKNKPVEYAHNAKLVNASTANNEINTTAGNANNNAVTRADDKVADNSNNNDLNAAESRPVKRRESTTETNNTNIPAAKTVYNSAPDAQSKSSEKYVTVPEYIAMNDGSGSLKIQNVSDDDLDLVVVDVMYYDTSGRFKKGETMYLHNLKANKTITIKTPRDLNASYATSKVSLVSSDANGVYAIGDN